jgi:hypothetical protein
VSSHFLKMFQNLSHSNVFMYSWAYFDNLVFNYALYTEANSFHYL